MPNLQHNNATETMKCLKTQHDVHSNDDKEDFALRVKRWLQNVRNSKLVKKNPKTLNLTTIKNEKKRFLLTGLSLRRIPPIDDPQVHLLDDSLLRSNRDSPNASAYFV